MIRFSGRGTERDEKEWLIEGDKIEIKIKVYFI